MDLENIHFVIKLKLKRKIESQIEKGLAHMSISLSRYDRIL